MFICAYIFYILVKNFLTEMLKVCDDISKDSKSFFSFEKINMLWLINFCCLEGKTIIKDFGRLSSLYN